MARAMHTGCLHCDVFTHFFPGVPSLSMTAQDLEGLGKFKVKRRVNFNWHNKSFVVWLTMKLKELLI